MAQGEELVVQAEEELSIFDRVRQLGASVLDTVTEGVHEYRQKALAVLAVGSAALGGGLALDMLSPEATSAAVSSSAGVDCQQYTEIMSPSQVTKAVYNPTGHNKQSLIEAAFNAVKDAKPSMKYVTHQPGSTYTETDAYYHARLSGSKKLGTYVFEIDSKGRLTSKSVKSIKLLELPATFSGVYWRSHAQFTPDRYGFSIVNGDFENEGPKGIDWTLSVGYGQNQSSAGSFSLSSMLANGEYFKNLLNLTSGVLTSVDSQFISVAERAEKDKTINYQAILPTLKNESACQG